MQSRREDQFAARTSLLSIHLDLADVLERLAGSVGKPGEIQHGRSTQSCDPQLAILCDSHVRISAGAFVRQKAVGASEIRVIDGLLLFALPAAQAGGADASDGSRSTGNPQVLLDHLDLITVEGCDSHQLAVFQTANPQTVHHNVEIAQWAFSSNLDSSMILRAKGCHEFVAIERSMPLWVATQTIPLLSWNTLSMTFLDNPSAVV